MCIVCCEFAKGKLSPEEGLTNLAELEESIPEEHYEEVADMLREAAELELAEDLQDEDDYGDLLDEIVFDERDYGDLG